MCQAILPLLEGLYLLAMPATLSEAVLLEGLHSDLGPVRASSHGLIRLQGPVDMFPGLHSLNGTDRPEAPTSARRVLELPHVPS